MGEITTDLFLALPVDLIIQVPDEAWYLNSLSSKSFRRSAGIAQVAMYWSSIASSGKIERISALKAVMRPAIEEKGVPGNGDNACFCRLGWWVGALESRISWLEWKGYTDFCQDFPFSHSGRGSKYECEECKKNVMVKRISVEQSDCEKEWLWKRVSWTDKKVWTHPYIRETGKLRRKSFRWISAVRIAHKPAGC